MTHVIKIAMIALAFAMLTGCAGTGSATAGFCESFPLVCDFDNLDHPVDADELSDANEHEPAEEGTGIPDCVSTEHDS